MTPTPTKFSAALIALAAAGCVTERRAVPTPAAPTGAQAPALPSQPIATPAPAGSTLNTSLKFALTPLGTVPYDGQVLPVLSPDGRFMAVQQGDPPTWPTLLARLESVPALSTRVVVYDLSDTTLRPLTPAEPWPAGSVLGRSADDRGFLIESPRDDGSRWIGRVAWVTAQVEWLVQGTTVNAHAVLSSQGVLAYARRPAPSTRYELVLRTPRGDEHVRASPDVSFQTPVFNADGSMISVLADRGTALEIITMRVETTPSGGVKTSLPLAHRAMGAPGDPALAYQITAPVQGTPVFPERPSGTSSPTPVRPVAVYHPDIGRMVEFDWRNASFKPLANASIAAVASPVAEPAGYFVTTPEGLLYTPWPESVRDPAPGRPAMQAKLVDTPSLARATRNPERPLILFGPSRDRGSPSLSVMAVGFPAQLPAEAEPNLPGTGR